LKLSWTILKDIARTIYTGFRRKLGSLQLAFKKGFNKVKECALLSKEKILGF